MEFLNQNKQNQRNTERFVLLLYSLYSVSLCLGIIRSGGELWVSGFLLIALGAACFLCLSKYRNYRVRAILTGILMQLSVILYAAHTADLSAVIPTFMVMSVLVAIYGFAGTIWIPLISLAFLIFYHGVIIDTFQTLSKEALFRLLLQLGNILCLEFTLYIWTKNRNKVTEQVHHMIEALMDAEQSKDDFLANVSHEIRTPVNTICGMSEMALREHEIDKMREELFDIRDAGHNLMSLVSDILDFSQLQQGKMNLEEEAYNITSTMNDIINMAMARKGEKQIEIIVDCAADIPNGLFGDEKKIRRVIMNLVDNAIKFTNEGGVIIKVSTRKESYGVNLCVSVKDTGIGIEAGSLEKLFESFSQVDTRRNRQKGGVGLGLAISKELVRKMGGTITVRSRLGKGSTFSFVVPQKVLEEKPIGLVKDRDKINVAAYFDMEQFDMMAIRDEYTNIIIHMVQQLKVRCHVCRNLSELKRRDRIEAFSHIFISLEEYQEDEEYFDELTRHTKVIMVIDRPREKYVSNPDIIRLYKPFYILPVVSILNGNGGSAGGKRMVRPGKFIAPGAHVLVVDDNRMNIRVVEGLLKEYQIKVTYATSGMEALDVIESMAFDFVFMDHMMPEMDGVETMHRIRDKIGHYYQRVPIVALTANAAPGSREMFLDEGFDDFVAKPIEASVLERVLKRNLPQEKLIFQSPEHTAEESFKEREANLLLQEKEISVKEEVQDGAQEEALVIGDLNVDNGILYCGGKEEYLEVLAAYCMEGEEEQQRLEAFYESKDWMNYTIVVHALKSGMKNIGADVLSEKAKALEFAGKNNDIDFILGNHDDMIAEYRRMVEMLRENPMIRVRIPEDAGMSPEEQWDAQMQETEDMPELTEETFDKLLVDLEDAMFSLDGKRMLEILAQLQEYQYHGVGLFTKLKPIREKVEKDDYMSAVDTLEQLRQRIKDGKEGGGRRS
ncbi:MAG: ATP-binding protein [Muribaculaceae bacterium]|nr:ATP-binding protein [Muribaculaceae bacterium]